MSKPGRISVYVIDPTGKTEFFYFQWIDPVTKKRKTKSSKCKTKRAAERAAVDFENDLNSRGPNSDGSISWDAFVDVYELDHMATLKESSRDRIRSVLNVFKKIVDPAKLSSITTQVLAAYASKLRAAPWNRGPSTVDTHISKLSTALAWAVDNDYLAAAPKPPKLPRVRGPRAKGRPLTIDEFAKFLSAVPRILPAKCAPSWSRLMIGLWLSGLRLAEALDLVWGDGQRHESTLWIDTTSGKYPMLGIVAESEKGGADRLLPLTPDFGRWILKVPKESRVGPVFPLVKWRRSNVVNADHVSKVISEIGKKSGVLVNATGKFASAHDLRRTFGLRWAEKLMPAQLQQLMRHADISTTMMFYAMVEAQSFGEQLWRDEA